MDMVFFLTWCVCVWMWRHCFFSFTLAYIASVIYLDFLGRSKMVSFAYLLICITTAHVIDWRARARAIQRIRNIHACIHTWKAHKQRKMSAHIFKFVYGFIQQCCACCSRRRRSIIIINSPSIHFPHFWRENAEKQKEKKRGKTHIEMKSHKWINKNRF